MSGRAMTRSPRSRRPDEGRPVTQQQLEAAVDALRRELEDKLDAALARAAAGQPGAAPPPGRPAAGSAASKSSSASGGSGGRVLPPLALPPPGDGEAASAVGGGATAAGRGSGKAKHVTWADEVAFDPEEEIALGGGMWDAAVLIGCPQVGVGGSAFTAFTLLLNIVVQVTFCLIVNDNMTHPAIDSTTVQDFRDWRTTIAHNVKFVDSLTYRSLARKVCTFRDAPLSSGPISGLAAISEYSPLEEERNYHEAPPLGYWFPHSIAGSDLSVGELMCCLALILWWFAVLKEIYSIISLCQALFSLPLGRTRLSDTPAGFVLDAVSRPRRVVFCAVACVRSLVCVSLAVCGTLYLVTTLSLGDLLLNALALEIVLSLDELTFEVLAPRSVRLLISSMAPLVKPRSRSWRGLDVRPVLAIAFIVAMLSSVHYFFLRDQSIILEDARRELCGGNLDFIATVDNTGLVVAFNPGPDYNDRVSDTEFLDLQYEYRAFRSLIENSSELVLDSYEGSLTGLAYGFRGSRFTVEGKLWQDLADATSQLNILCYDLDYPGSELWGTVSEVLNSLDVSEALSGGSPTAGPFLSCVDVGPRCGEESTFGTRARQYCPVTCGCDHAASALALFVPEHGCPAACTTGQRYLQTLGGMTCSDWAPESPRTYHGADWYQGTDLVQAYKDGLRQTTWPPEVIEHMIQTMSDAIATIGCAGVAQAMLSYNDSDPTPWQFGNLCAETNLYGFRPITTICPVSCGCQETHALLCPTSC